MDPVTYRTTRWTRWHAQLPDEPQMTCRPTRCNTRRRHDAIKTPTRDTATKKWTWIRKPLTLSVSYHGTTTIWQFWKLSFVDDLMTYPPPYPIKLSIQVTVEVTKEESNLKRQNHVCFSRVAWSKRIWYYENDKITEITVRNELRLTNELDVLNVLRYSNTYLTEMERDT